MTQPVIQLRGVTAVYANGATPTQALRGVQLDIHPGEIFGLLGPNGAGKTTLLSCIEGLHRPVQGQVTVDGVDVLQNPQLSKQKLGIQLQRTALFDDLTVAELVEVYAALYQVYLRREQITSLLQRFDLLDKQHTYARRLSGGQQQRLVLVLAIANNPQVVLLDEPTSALDPHARRQVWQQIRQLHEEGRTVVITTHAMEEAEALCGRVAIIDQGQVIACDTPARLIANLASHPVLKTSADLPLEQIRPLPGVRQVRYAGQHVEVETADPQTTLVALHELARQNGRMITDVMVRQPNLEDVFLQLTGRALN